MIGSIEERAQSPELTKALRRQALGQWRGSIPAYLPPNWTVF